MKHRPDLATPAPVPVDTYIDAIWRAVSAGAITWPELRELQAQYERSKQPIPIPPRKRR